MDWKCLDAGLCCDGECGHTKVPAGTDPDNRNDTCRLSGYGRAEAAKKRQNLLTELLMEQLRADGLTDLLMMGAGLWKHVFCISSYCVDAQKMADAVGMKGWADDGKIRYFSLILF